MVCVEWVVEGVGGAYVVDRVGFSAADGAGGVVGEESGALAFEVCCCSCFAVLVCCHVVFLLFVFYRPWLRLRLVPLCLPQGPTLGPPHGSPVVTDWSPSLLRTDTIRVLVVRTLLKRLTLPPIQVSHPKIGGAFVYPRSRVFYQLTAIANVGLVLSVVSRWEPVSLAASHAEMEICSPVPMCSSFALEAGDD